MKSNDNPPGYDPKKDSVVLTPYNPAWPEKAESEILTLKQMLPSALITDIQHVGSTAIPGMLAKPIIDIQIAVNSLDQAKEKFVPIIESLGYQYWDGNPNPERMFFVKGMPPFGEGRTHHIHIFQKDSNLWRDKIIFRDYLKSHPEAAKEYTDLKSQLSEQHALDREEYTDAKKAFVDHIIAKALGVL